MKIRKGDVVKVIAGKDRGKTGRVLSVDQKDGRVLVEKINLVKRHQRPTQKYRQGGIIEKEAPIHVSNVMYFDQGAGKATRIGLKFIKDKKVRVSKCSGEVLEAAKT